MNEYLDQEGLDLYDSLLKEELSAMDDDVDDLKNAVDEQFFEFQVQFPRCFWIRKAGLTSAGANNNNNARATTWGSLSMFKHKPIKIVSMDENISFQLYDTINLEWASEVVKELVLYYSNGIKIVLRTDDDSEITGTDIDKLFIYTCYEASIEFEKYFNVELTQSSRFKAYSDTDTYTTRYKLDITAGNEGTLLMENTPQRATFRRLICNVSDCIVWCGQMSTSSLSVVINNTLMATLNRGDCYKIEKGTPFVLGFNTSSTNPENTVERVCFYIIPDSTPDLFAIQLISADALAGQDTCFIVDNKIFSIGRENTGFSVKQGNSWIVSGQSLGQNVGHANSCNYDASNNKVYVSDWTIPTNIYVFSVDASNNTLTYDKTITVPLDANMGSTEYFVTDHEKQIFFLGWETGNSANNPNALIFGLYILTTTGYVLAWQKKTVRAICVQSMVVQDNYIYYVEVDPDNSYYTVGVNRINMSTGETEYSSTSFSGSILSHEAEGIAPIGKQAFILLTRDGYTFLHLFKKAETYSNYIS